MGRDLIRAFVQPDRRALRILDDRDTADFADGHHRRKGLGAELDCLGQGAIDVVHATYGIHCAGISGCWVCIMPPSPIESESSLNSV